MIVYNVKRRWFPMKNDADLYRRTKGLPPSDLYKLTIETREDLAALLNGLCGIEPMHRHIEAAGEVIPEAVIARNEVHAPDCVPKFLVDAWAKIMKE